MILELNNVSKSFGGLKAVDEVSMTLSEAQVSSIIGPNGAGKTTVFNLITGDLKLDSGVIIAFGKDISRLGARAITREGIGRSFQIVNFFQNMSAQESIVLAILAREKKSWNFFRKARGCVEDEAFHILNIVGLSDKASLTTGELAAGDMKRVEIGMVLALKPRLMLLDEPTAGMSRVEKQGIVDLLKQINLKDHCAMLITEHDMNVILAISDVIHVMHNGKVIERGNTEEIRKSNIVRKVYLGEK
jgi:branched-chain amino acid transport system ATP-binding protein